MARRLPGALLCPGTTAAGVRCPPAHGRAGGTDDSRQPILLSTTPDAPNLARNLLIADGEWRDAALGFDRAFYLFDGATLSGAREAWKQLAEREGIERRYWANEDGKWVNKS